MPQLLIKSEAGETSSLFIADHPVSIGRRRDNILCLPHLSVSGYHAKIFPDKSCLILQDLNSTNGTKVNGEPIHQHLLAHLDEITIGSYTISYSETYKKPKEVAETVNNVSREQSIAPIIDPAMILPDEELAVIRVVTGNKRGSIISLVKPITTIGKTGEQLAAISKKPTGYYMLPMTEHASGYRHNGVIIDPQVEIKLVTGDLIDIGDECLEFVHPYVKATAYVT